jgi:hypothetical protein
MVLAPSAAGLFKWRKFEPEVILLAAGWYFRFSLSYRDVEGSGANFIKCMYLSGERLCRFKRPGPRSKFPERWFLVD